MNTNTKSNKKERPILFIDGLNCFIRYYLANQSINDKSEPIGGVVGFIKFLDYMTSLHVPQKIFVVWEAGGSNSRRRKIYPEYKKDRGKLKEFKKIKAGTASMRDQLATDKECKVQQLSLLYKLLKTTPICQVFVSGTECDDVIAYLVTQEFRKSEAPKIVISNDKDFYQLLENKTVKIYDLAKKSYVTNNDVFKKYNITSRNFCLARALVGDVSDNIEGVPGVGLKTAAKRFPMLADDTRDVMIKDILEECDRQLAAGAKQKVFKEVKDCENIIRRNWKLMYLDSSILSGQDITKIQYIVENHEPKMNQIALIKEVLLAGIAMPFDFEQFSSRLRNTMTYVGV